MDSETAHVVSPGGGFQHVHPHRLPEYPAPQLAVPARAADAKICRDVLEVVSHCRVVAGEFALLSDFYGLMHH